MTPEFIASIAAAVKDLTLSSMLLIFIWGAAKQYIVFGWVYAEKKREADRWMNIALSGTSLAQRAIEAGKTTKEGDDA